MHWECILAAVLAGVTVGAVVRWRDRRNETAVLRQAVLLLSERVPALAVELPRAPGAPACPKCRGSGYVSEGVYCDCGMGKDLARLKRFDERRFGA